MPEPVLTIVTPVLNAAAHLPRCMASIADQPLAPGLVEHIILDGGSGDGSAELVRAHAARHPALVTHWATAPDGGQSDAINRGLAMARGTWGAWLNADDWYEPSALADVVRTLRDADDADVVAFRARLVDDAGRTVWAPRPPEPISLANLMRLQSQWYAGRSLVQPEVFFRTAIFAHVGGLCIGNHYTMDHELWMSLAAAGARFRDVDRLVASQGVHAGQKTARRYESRRCAIDVTRRMLAAHRARLGPDADDVARDIDAFEAFVEGHRAEWMA